MEGIRNVRGLVFKISSTIAGEVLTGGSDILMNYLGLEVQDV